MADRLAERLTLSGDSMGVYLNDAAGAIRYGKPTLRELSVTFEEATGYDSIPTIERVYGDADDRAALHCQWPDCEYRTYDAELMWRHVHGLRGRKHKNNFTLPERTK